MRTISNYDQVDRLVNQGNRIRPMQTFVALFRPVGMPVAYFATVQ